MIAEMAKADQTTVQARLSALFSEVMHIDVPSIHTDLFVTGILDSQKFVELLLHIEQSFQTQIDIGDFEVENFRCIEKISNLIVQQNGGNQAVQSSPTGAV